MELYQLRTFKMVAEVGHLTKAARKLHASQPAVSAHIKNLEDELGVHLFVRTPRGMVLTSEGVELRKYAEQALATVDEMAILAGTMQGTLAGKLRIGLNSDPDFLRISELFAAMRSRHPELGIHLLQSMTGEVLNKLEDDMLDVGFMFGQNSSEKIHTLKLRKLCLIVAGPADWQEKLDAASPEDLGNFPWIMTPEDCPYHTVTSQFFEKFNLNPQEVAMADQESAIRAMISGGAGLSFLIEEDAARENQVMVSTWTKEKLYLDLSIACLKKRREELLLKTVFSMLGGIWGGPDK